MQSNNSKRHGLSADQARELSQKILGFAKADHTRVNIDSGVHGFTRTALNRVTSFDTNRLENASLERAVRYSEALAKIAPENPEYLPELGPQRYAEVDG